MKGLQEAIFRTLAYADIFDYPLRKSEVWEYLISGVRIEKEDVLKELVEIKADEKRMEADKGFYFLKGRKKVVVLRQKREKWSREKLKIVRKVAGWLKLIPTIKMLAVTGALAMRNSNQKDDVDLLLITSKNRLWLTRFLAVFIVELVADRRRPGDKKVKNKICLNMFLDEKHLAVPLKEQDLFSAHEVCQLKPIWDRDETYQKFIRKNQWVKQFLPNWKPEKKHLKGKHLRGGAKTRPLSSEVELKDKKNLGGEAIDKLENLTMNLQLRYMAKRKTTEITELGRIRFHPKDAREWVLKEYQKRLKKLGVK